MGQKTSQYRDWLASNKSKFDFSVYFSAMVLGWKQLSKYLA